jgi:hypothetical protein
MATVIPFPKKSATVIPVTEQNQWVRSVVTATTGALKVLVWLFLAWIGGPFTFLLRLFAAIALFALPVIALGLHSPHKTAFLLWTAGTGFFAFAGAAGFDRLVRWLR